MYKKNTITVTRTQDNNIMGLKGFLVKITLLLILVLSVVGTTKSVQGKPLSYVKSFKEDLQGTDLTKNKCNKMVKYVEKHTYKPNKVYTVNTRVGKFHVIRITNRNGRKKFFNLMEHRTLPVVCIEYGYMYNNKGDGCTTDGCYIGYRYGSRNQYTMKFNTYKKITTICVSPGTNKYTDSISYRKDTQK